MWCWKPKVGALVKKVALETRQRLLDLCALPVTKVLLIYALNVTELANPHFNSCLCKMVCRENKNYDCSPFSWTYSSFSCINKNTRTTKMWANSCILSGLMNYAKEKKRKAKQNIPYLHPVFTFQYSWKAGNRHLCFLSRSANNCRLSHHKHGGRVLDKLPETSQLESTIGRNLFHGSPFFWG